MDFFEENNLTEKHLVMLDFVLNHYEEKGFWCFEIALPEEYQFLFEDSENNNIGKIISRPRKIILEGLNHYFILDGLPRECIQEFDNNASFYFRFHNNHINLENENIVNVLASNPMT